MRVLTLFLVASVAFAQIYWPVSANSWYPLVFYPSHYQFPVAPLAALCCGNQAQCAGLDRSGRYVGACRDRNAQSADQCQACDANACGFGNVGTLLDGGRGFHFASRKDRELTDEYEKRHRFGVSEAFIDMGEVENSCRASMDDDAHYHEAISSGARERSALDRESGQTVAVHGRDTATSGASGINAGGECAGACTSTGTGTPGVASPHEPVLCAPVAPPPAVIPQPPTRVPPPSVNTPTSPVHVPGKPITQTAGMPVYGVGKGGVRYRCGYNPGI